MEVSCSAAYNHINTYVHPQATIVDGSGFEERYFMVGVKDRANSLGNTVIDLPENVEQNMMWITLMDSHSLAGKLPSRRKTSFTDECSLEQGYF